MYISPRAHVALREKFFSLEYISFDSEVCCVRIAWISFQLSLLFRLILGFGCWEGATDQFGVTESIFLTTLHHATLPKKRAKELSNLPTTTIQLFSHVHKHTLSYIPSPKPCRRRAEAEVSSVCPLFPRHGAHNLIRFLISLSNNKMIAELHEMKYLKVEEREINN
jgi:hypothetical protein